MGEKLWFKNKPSLRDSSDVFLELFLPLIHASISMHASFKHANKLLMYWSVLGFFCGVSDNDNNSHSLYEDVGHGWKTPQDYKCLENSVTTPIANARKFACSVNCNLYFFCKQIKILILEKSKRVPPVKSFRFITKN